MTIQNSFNQDIVTVATSMTQEESEIRLSVSAELRDNLEVEWWGDYSEISYPFFHWVTWKYNAKLIRPPANGYVFDLEFKTKEDKFRFEEKWQITK